MNGFEFFDTTIAYVVASLSEPIAPSISYIASAWGYQIWIVQAAIIGCIASLVCVAGYLLIYQLGRTKRAVKPQTDKKGHQADEAHAPLAFALSSAKRVFVVVAFFSCLINLLMLVSPLYMLQVYDRVLTSRSHETLIYLTILAVSLIGFNAFLELIRSRILVRIGVRLDEHLSWPVFQALFKTKTPSESTQALNDLATVRNFLGGSGPNAFFDAPWTPAFIALIFVFHPLLGVIAAVGAILLFIVALTSEAVTRSVFGEAHMHSREASFFANAALRNQEVIKGMGMLPDLTQRWSEKNAAALNFQSVANDRVGLLSALSKLIRPVLQISMLGTGAYLVLQEATSPGVMIASSIIMGRALAPVESAVSQWRSFVAARGSYFRLKTMLNEVGMPLSKTSLPAPTGQLSVESLKLTPPGAEKPVLHDVSFEIAAGEVLAVIGASAAGKSTLARAIVGIWPLDDGHIRLDGADLTQWLPEELGPHIGYLPQDVELFAGTIAENISRFGEEDSAKVIAAAKLADAHGMILHQTDGYDTQIGPNGRALSGGQRQRVGLARALYNNPALIVLDEPNASLDSTGERALMSTIGRLKEQGQTVIIISHRSNILRAVDKVLILNAGEVEAFERRERVMPKLVGAAQPLHEENSKPKQVTRRKQSKGEARDA